MAKISTYPSADTPLLLSDRLIGTEAPRIPPLPIPLATKNFSLSDLLNLFSVNFPAASLQAVLNTGNTATQNIFLTGQIDVDVIKPVNIEDPTGSQGTVFQYLSKGTSSINWVNLPVDNLQAVLNSGNTATQNITLVGNVTSTYVTPGNIKDELLNTGAVGQVLTKSTLGVQWKNSSVPTAASLADVLLTGNSATNDINLTGDMYATSFVKSGGTSSEFLKADGSIDSSAYALASSLPTVTSDLTNDGDDGINPFISLADVPAQVNSDWNSTSGVSEILNKPTLNSGTVTSVALTMPSAFSVANSPVTTSGSLDVTGAGTVSQYVRGDGSLANFPASTGGGSSLAFYLNGSVAQGTFGGIAFKEMDRTPILGTGTDFTINANGYIQSFITDANVPNQLEIPAGNWNFETYFSASSSGGTPSFYVELYKWNGATLSLIASNSATPEGITNGTAIDAYFSALAVPQTTLAATDRLAIRIYVTHSGRTITLHTENSHLCEVITTFSTGLTALNGLTAQVQNFATGTSGTDFAISSATSTHTFNLPTASATNRGALSSADWSTFNGKQDALGFTAENTANKQNSLAVDGTGVKFPTVDAVNSLSFIDKGKRMVSFFTDWLASATLDGGQFFVSGGTAAIVPGAQIPNRTNQQGVIFFQTNIIATNYVNYCSSSTVQLWFGGGAWNYETSININTLSVALERYRMIFGFGSSIAPGSETDGIFITYDEGGTANGTISSANWQCVTSANSVRTLTTSTTAVTAAAWNKLRIEVNAAGTSVTFYVNGTAIATHTTNIPLASNSRYVLMKTGLVKTIGLTTRGFYCDYIGYENILTTAR